MLEEGARPQMPWYDVYVGTAVDRFGRIKTMCIGHWIYRISIIWYWTRFDRAIVAPKLPCQDACVLCNVVEA